MASAETSANVYEFVDATKQELTKLIEEKHKRHGDTLLRIGQVLDGLEARVATAEAMIRANDVLVKNLGDRKVEISNVRLTPQMWLASIVFAVSIVSGMRWATWGFSDQMKDQKAALDLIKQKQESDAKLQDERAGRWNNEIAIIRGNVQMVDTKISNLMITVANSKR